MHQWQKAAHSRFKSDIRIKPEQGRRAKPRRAPVRGAGLHRAQAIAASPNRARILNEHLWFCLAHARAHNESWDFFKGMDDDEIQAFREEAMTGHRPTWPLGKRAAKARMAPGAAGRCE